MLINKKSFHKLQLSSLQKRGIILVKMNFMLGTFLISRTKVVIVVSLEGENIVVFERVGSSPFLHQLDFEFKTYVVSRSDDYK